MKKGKKELDVDFIGGVGPLTKEEEKRISDVIKSFRAKKRNAYQIAGRKFATRKKVAL
jgi:hypothetical protein